MSDPYTDTELDDGDESDIEQSPTAIPSPLIDSSDVDSDSDTELPPPPAVDTSKAPVLGESELVPLMLKWNGLATADIPHCHSLTIFQQHRYRRIQSLRPFQSLKTLEIICQNITVIEGLESLPSLTSLNLNYNKINSLHGLQSLRRLQRLLVDENALTEVDCLQSLTNLEFLSVTNNRISKVKSLEKCLSLTTVRLDGNALASVSSSQSPSVPVSVTSLSLAGNQLSSFADLLSLASLTSLTSLTLTSTSHGSNPVCALYHYHTYTLYHFPSLTTLDEQSLAKTTVIDAQATWSKKSLFYTMRQKLAKRTLTERCRAMVAMMEELICRSVSERRRQWWQYRSAANQSDDSDAVATIDRAHHSANTRLLALSHLYHRTVTHSLPHCQRAIVVSLERELHSGGNERLEQCDSERDAVIAMLVNRGNFANIDVRQCHRVRHREQRLRFDRRVDSEQFKRFNHPQSQSQSASVPASEPRVEYVYWIRAIDRQCEHTRSSDNNSIRVIGDRLFDDRQCHDPWCLADAVTDMNSHTRPLCFTNSINRALQSYQSSLSNHSQHGRCRVIHGVSVLVCRVLVASDCVVRNESGANIDISAIKTTGATTITNINPPTKLSNAHTGTDSDSDDDSDNSVCEQLIFVTDRSLICAEYILCVNLNTSTGSETCADTDSAEAIISTGTNTVPFPSLVSACEPIYDEIHRFCRWLDRQSESLAALSQSRSHTVAPPVKGHLSLSQSHSLASLASLSLSSLTSLDLSYCHLSLASLSSLALQSAPLLRALWARGNAWAASDKCEIVRTVRVCQSLTLLDLSVESPSSLPSLIDSAYLQLALEFFPRLEWLDGVAVAHVGASIEALASESFSDWCQCYVYVPSLPSGTNVYTDADSHTDMHTDQPTKLTLAMIRDHSYTSLNPLPSDRPPVTGDWQSVTVSINLDSLSLSSLALADTEADRPFTGFAQLKCLSLANNHLASLEPLSAIPLLSLTELNYDTNTITMIENLHCFPSLTKLDLNKNRLQKLNFAVFAALPLLTSLSVESNDLAALTGLDQCQSLIELYLGNNAISSHLQWQSIFSSSTQLLIVDFIGNPVYGQPVHRLLTIFSVPNVRLLDGVSVSSSERQSAVQLYSGRLTVELLAQSLFHCHYHSVERLTLTNAGLRSVDCLTGALVPNLVELTLDCNDIDSLASFNSLPLLKILRLNGNRISEVGSGSEVASERAKRPIVTDSNTVASAITGTTATTTNSYLSYCFPSLQVLELGYNRLSNLAKLNLRGLSRLLVLVLEGNDIQRVDSASLSLGECCPRLQHLLLSRNRIKSFDTSALNSQLQSLTLEDNLIKSLHFHTMFEKLHCLYLAGNKVMEWSDIDSLHQCRLPVIQSLTLTNNIICRKHLVRIQCLQRMPSLSIIDGKSVTTDERERMESINASIANASTGTATDTDDQLPLTIATALPTFVSHSPSSATHWTHSHSPTFAVHTGGSSNPSSLSLSGSSFSSLSWFQAVKNATSGAKSATFVALTQSPLKASLHQPERKDLTLANTANKKSSIAHRLSLPARLSQ